MFSLTRAMGGCGQRWSDDGVPGCHGVSMAFMNCWTSPNEGPRLQSAPPSQQVEAAPLGHMTQTGKPKEPDCVCEGISNKSGRHIRAVKTRTVDLHCGDPQRRRPRSYGPRCLVPACPPAWTFSATPSRAALRSLGATSNGIHAWMLHSRAILITNPLMRRELLTRHVP